MPTKIDGTAIQCNEAGYFEFYDRVLDQWFIIEKHFSGTNAQKAALGAKLTDADEGLVSFFDTDDHYNYWWGGVVKGWL